MTAEAEGAAVATEPTFPHSAYGVHLNSYGEEGGMIALGRVDPMRFIAACNKLRRELDIAVFLDGADAEDALGIVSHCWLVPVPCPDPQWEWYLESVPEGTPGARQYTVAEW